mgnify:CR=1 FL=1
MKKYLNQNLCLLLLLLLWQQGIGQITAGSTLLHLSSPNADSAGVTVDDMIKLDMSEVLQLQEMLNTGIIADINESLVGSVVLDVYYYHNTNNNSDSRKMLLYHSQSFISSSQFTAPSKSFNNTNYYWPLAPINNYFWNKGKYWSGTNIKRSAMTAAKHFVENQDCFSTSNAAICNFSKNVNKQKIPVVVEVYIQNATLDQFNIPGLGEQDAYTFFYGLPANHGCLGVNTAECEALMEMRHGDKNEVVVTAHRGYWGYGNIAEGSMDGLENGYNNNYVSIELDVQQSKDGELLLLHDQKINRMISFMATKGQEYPTWDTGTQTDANVVGAWIQNLNYNTTTSNIPKAGGGTWSTYPALKDGRMIDRRGVPTSDPVSRLNDALAYIQNGDKPILLSLDIKEKEEARYLETFSKCLTLAKQYNCLHKIIFKPGSTVTLSAETIKTYLSDPSRDQWNDFAYKSNTVVIIVKNNSMSTADKYVPPTREFIDGWMKVPSVICFEYIYKYNDASLDVLLKELPEFNNKSVIAYTKDKGFRTGAFWEIATECRGVPSGTVYAWYSKTSVDKTLVSQESGPDILIDLGVDARNNPEFTIAPPSYNSNPAANFPGVIVTDRPDLVQHILELHGRYNTKSKRP